MPLLVRLAPAAPSATGSDRLSVPPERPLVFRSRSGNPAARVEHSPSGRIRVTALNGTPVLVNDRVVESAELAHGDILAVGRDRFQVAGDPAPDVVEPGPAPAQRISKRLSVERTSPVAAKPSTSGLLSRVSSAFNTKDRARLAALELERKQLLLDAGLASLLGGGLGLGPEKLARVLRGEALTIAPGDLDPAAIDHWRQRRRRLDEIDRAIDALRSALGMPAATHRLVPVPSDRDPSVAGQTADEIGTQQIR